MRNSAICVLCGIIGSWELAFILSSFLYCVHPDVTASTGAGTAAALLGECRVVLSRHYYDKADEYLHSGIPHQKDMAFRDTFYQVVQDEISPSGHFHICDDKVKEMMPWLKLAIESDPHNPEIYLVSAFWLEKSAERPDLALDILKQAQVNIPFQYEVQLEQGRIYLKLGKLEKASYAFDAGLNFLNLKEPLESEQHRHDKARMLQYRALIYEAEGDIVKAIEYLDRYLVIESDHHEIKARRSALKNGTMPPLKASKYWTELMYREDINRKVCEHEEKHGQDEHEAHIHGPDCEH